MGYVGCWLPSSSDRPTPVQHFYTVVNSTFCRELEVMGSLQPIQCGSLAVLQGEVYHKCEHFILCPVLKCMTVCSLKLDIIYRNKCKFGLAEKDLSSFSTSA